MFSFKTNEKLKFKCIFIFLLIARVIMETQTFLFERKYVEDRAPQPELKSKFFDYEATELMTI